MGFGLCVRCPKVGRTGADQNEKSPSHPSYCKECIREYNATRYRKQTATKDMIPVMRAKWSEVALALADEPPNLVYIKALVSGALRDLDGMGADLVGVGRSPIRTPRAEKKPSLESLMEQFHKVMDTHKDSYFKNVIKVYYPDAVDPREPEPEYAPVAVELDPDFDWDAWLPSKEDELKLAALKTEGSRESLPDSPYDIT